MMSDLRLETQEEQRRIARFMFMFMLQRNLFSTDPDVYVSTFLPHLFRVPHNTMFIQYDVKTLQL